MGIEGEESVALQGALNQIEFKDAEMRAQGLRDSIQVLNAMIAKKLGQGNLNIQREMVALDRARLELQNAMFDFDQAKWWASQNVVDNNNNGTETEAERLAREAAEAAAAASQAAGGSGSSYGGGGGGNPYATSPENNIYADRTDSYAELLRSIFGDPRGINSSWGGTSPWAGGGGTSQWDPINPFPQYY